MPTLEVAKRADRPAGGHRRGRRRPGAAAAGRRQHAQDHAVGGGARPRLRAPTGRRTRGSRGGARRTCRRQGHRHRVDRDRAGHTWVRATDSPATENDTTIVGPHGQQNLVDARVSQLGKLSASGRSSMPIRTASICASHGSTGRVAVIRVGGATSVELKERMLRVEDALAATRAALEAGIVSGGGTALAQAHRALDTLELVGDEAIGRDVVRRALGGAAAVDRDQRRIRGRRRGGRRRRSARSGTGSTH